MMTAVSPRVCDEHRRTLLQGDHEVARAACVMPPMFQCLICGQTIERSMRSFWKRKGHLLCSTCRDRLDSGETSHNEATAPQ